MNSVVPQFHPHQDSSTSRHTSDELRQAVSSSHTILDQTPPPSLREILAAYRNKGDGDRDMLLAMLNAKTAEDQRIASAASLQRSLIELYQHSSESLQPPHRNINGGYHYPQPPFILPSHACDQRSSRRGQNIHARSTSRSPPRMQAHLSLPPRDVVVLHHSEHPRKRHRPSRSPHITSRSVYESSHPSDQFPPSPYSSSDRSNSAEYSPRSRASMAIGSLLSTGPRREINGDAVHQERD